MNPHPYLLMAFLVVTSASCSFDPEKQCDTDSQCPSDHSCVDGFCFVSEVQDTSSDSSDGSSTNDFTSSDQFESEMEQCPPTSCAIGESVCVDDQNFIICVDDGSGCGAPSSPRPCSEGASCVNGGCRTVCHDEDGDGFGTGCDQGSDCDDGDADVNPAAQEECDGVDNDCDPETGESNLTRSCYTGPIETRGVGLCHDGLNLCINGHFTEICEGEVLPADEVCGDQFDNDCDREIDETCCAYDPVNPETAPCYSHTDATLDVGICHGGIMTCQPDGTLSPCEGEQLPEIETCSNNGTDDDCNGIEDDVSGLHQPCDTGQEGYCSHGTLVCAGQETPSCQRLYEPRNETCDNMGIDDNCDGQVDNILWLNTSCTNEENEEAWGVCQAGTYQCVTEQRSCVSNIEPGSLEESCNGYDDDCDGYVDELPECENDAPVVTCPSDFTCNPLQTVNFSASAVDPNGDTMSYRWEVISAPHGSVASPDRTNSLSTALFLDLAGDYCLQFTATDESGLSSVCTVTITAIFTNAFRVELVWNIGELSDASDLDLHLMRNNGRWDGSQDCHYHNCNASYGRNLEWGEPGDSDNPRLDLDDVEGNGPENISINQPENGIPYTIGVHYRDADGHPNPSYATIRVYCNSLMMQEFGPQAINVYGPASVNEVWIVADVIWNDGNCTITERNEITIENQL